MTLAEREAFILSQMHRIEYYAREFARRYAKPSGNAFERADLINEGVIGALNACHDFDPSKGAALHTYATYRIQGAMLDFIKSRKVDPLSRNQRREVMRGERYFALEPLPEGGLGGGSDPGPGSMFNAMKHAALHTRMKSEPIDIRKLCRWARLTKRERFIIYAHFIEGYQLQELCERLNVHASRISQLKQSAMKKLTAVAAN